MFWASNLSSEDIHHVPWGLLFYVDMDFTPQYTQIRNINMYKLIEIRHNILILCHGNYIMIKKFNFMLKINILRNSSQKT